jgi:hypothetical protein
VTSDSVPGSLRTGARLQWILQVRVFHCHSLDAHDIRVQVLKDKNYMFGISTVFNGRADHSGRAV